MSTFAPIAIVGRACLVPGAHTPDALWSLVAERRSALREVPPGRFRVPTRDVIGVQGASVDRTYSTVGGYVEGFAFDDAGLALERGELAGLDPLFGWLCHTGRAALADAGIDPPAQRAGTLRAGAVVGNLSFPTEAMTAWGERAALTALMGVNSQELPRPFRDEVDPRNRFMSGLPAHTMARALGLSAGAFALDAACASSLYALALAARALHDGRADVMLAGAVNRADSLFLHVGFSALQALSPTGRSRPFDRRADGLVPAEGCALVALMRLDDAVAQGKHVYGVLRGVGLSNDGRAKNLLAPSSEGQVRALRAAWAQAGIDDPRDAFDLFECHATGTPMGDRAEVVTLIEALGAPVSRTSSTRGSSDSALPVSSLKGNLGHLITAAGAAGLLKVLSGFSHETLPPSIGGDDDLRVLDLLDGRAGLLVQERAAPWRARSDRPRRAGLSAFGFGGNNAHAVVEEWRPTPRAQVAMHARVPDAPDATARALAVVAIGVRAGAAHTFAEVGRALVDGARVAPEHELAVSLDDVRFPPNDLRESLAQQLLVFEAARAATAQIAHAADALPRERTGVLIGMGTDVQVTTPGVRWRAAALARGAGGDGGGDRVSTAAALRDAAMPPLAAQGVLGCMPNIPANRLNVQLDVRGPGFTISAEQQSGTRALEVAATLIAHGEIDACVVGATEANRDARHALASAVTNEVGGDDAAVALVLMTPVRADALGLRVLATITTHDDAPSVDAHRTFASVGGVGVVHAAQGLFEIVRAIAATSAGVHPSGEPWLAADRALTAAPHALGTPHVTRFDVRAPATPSAAIEPAPPFVFVSASSREQLRERLVDAHAARVGAVPSALEPWRAFVSAPSTDALRTRARSLADALRERESVSDVGARAGRASLAAADVCLTFGTAAQPTPWPARDLLRAFPDAGFALAAAIGEERARAVLAGRDEPPGFLGDLLIASAQMQVHAGFVRDVLGVSAGHHLGVSLGESNALFACGAWTDLFAMLDQMKSDGLFTRLTGGEHVAARAYWREHGDPAFADGAAAGAPPWKAVVARAPRAAAEIALRAPDLAGRAFILVVHTNDELELGGAPAAVDELVKRLGASAAHVPHMPAVHCPLLDPAALAYRASHRRPVQPVATTVWSHGPMAPLPITPADAARLGAAHLADVVADAILAQASRTVDVPALLAKAHAGGAQLFVDLSPRGLVGAWTRRALPGARVATLDGGVASALDVIGALVVAGVDVDLPRALGRFSPPAPPPAHTLAKPAHAYPRHPEFVTSMVVEPISERMASAPPLPRILPNAARAPADVQEHGAVTAPPPDAPLLRAPESEAPGDDGLAALREVAALSDASFTAFLAHARDGHDRFVAHQEARLTALASLAPHFAAPVAPRTCLWDRADLERLASGRISDVWGPVFAPQDHFRRQVRMPEPPLLLADRVMAIDAQPGVLEKDRSIQTETDVRWDSWYLHEGRCPAGILIETGQADLLLVSYMGVDFENRGDRVYRLLGCDLTYRGRLPLAGTTLAHDIHVDGYANHNDTRIFFFHSLTTDKATNAPLLEVRNGQAGFFTDAELANSGGVLWKPTDVAPAALAHLPNDRAPVTTSKRALSRDELEAFATGDAARCFGAGFERAHTHVRSPRIPSGDMLLIDRVTELALDGGPWGRGYLRAELDLADRWFFDGHFKDDPCMPGTVMFEGCLETLAVFLAARGFTLDKDGFLFEPAQDQPFKLRCRGQAIPRSRLMTYEVFVKSTRGGREPAVVADILVTVDGLKSLHCENVELVLARDWPLTSRSDLLGETARTSSEDAVGGLTSARANEACAFDQRSLLATGIGRPAEAFPGLYDAADARGRVPRLPGPPFHFMSRVIEVGGPAMGSLLRGESAVGTTAVVAYDVPPDAWYFAATASSSGATMPFSVLLEVALQPCGWVSSYVGSALTTDADLMYRNLDGKGTLHREIARDIGTLMTTVTLTKSSASAGMIIQELTFAVRTADGAPVYDGSTVFGFFPPAAFERQAGVGSTPEQRARLELVSPSFPVAAAAPATATSQLRIPAERLRMIDRVCFAAPSYVRTEKTVDTRDWYFRAHFYEDPVQPGSLGIEAMVQALQWLAASAGADEGMQAPRFQALAPHTSHTWRYRGQVVPTNRRVDVEVDLISMVREANGVTLTARGALWVDGLRIYTCDGLSVRVVDDG